MTLSLINSDTRLRAQGENPNIDLTVLTNNFELGLPKATFNYNINRNRGRSSSELTVQLFPKKPGPVVIPKFTVNQLSTRPIEITVHQFIKTETPDVFVKNGSSQKEIYVNQQAVAYIDLYHRIDLKSAKLGGAIDTQPTAVDIIHLPPVEFSKTVKGLKYNVTRTAWAISPRTLTDIKVMFPDIWVIDQSEKKIRFPFADTTISVIATPPDTPPDLIMGKPQISDHLGSNETTKNSPIKWTIRLTANVNSRHLRDKIYFSKNTGNIGFYIDKMQTNIIYNAKQLVPLTENIFDIFIMPTQAGQQRTPEISIPYFDIKNNIIHSATLLPQTIDVKPQAATIAEKPLRKTSTDIINPKEKFQSWWIFVAGILIFSSFVIIFINKRRSKNKPSLEKKKNVTKNTNKNSDNKALLLSAMNTLTLEQGLKKYEQQFGKDEEVWATVLAVQQYYYGKKSQTKPTTITMENTLRKLKRLTLKEPSPTDPWLPENFIP